MSGGGAVGIGSESYVIFTVNIPQDSFYSVFLQAYSCGEQVLSLFFFNIYFLFSTCHSSFSLFLNYLWC